MPATLHALLLGTTGFGPVDFAALFGHFLLLSLLAVGGAITTAPDLHRYIVGERGWLGDATFTESIAIAQAAPGPNVLFVAVIGFNVAGLAGALAAMAGNLLPSTSLALMAARYGHRHRTSRAVRAFSAGMAPLTIALLVATGWILALPLLTGRGPLPGFGAALLAFTIWTSWRYKWHPVGLIAVGAVCGAMGWV